MYPLVLDLADDGSIPVTVTCRVLGFTTQGFYRWCANPVSSRDWDDAHLINAIIDIHTDDPEFGYRFIADELHAAGHQASENRVQRLCSLQKIASSILTKRRGSGKTPGPLTRSRCRWSGHVLDRTDVELALGGGVLRDIGQPDLIQRLGVEDPLDVIVVEP